MVTFVTFSQFSIYLLMYLGFPVMPDHPVLETRKYLLHRVFRSITWLFPLFCSATGLSLSSATAGLWSCFGVTTLSVPGVRMKSFLSTSSEKPCSWAALTVAVFIIIYWSCGLHYVIFFCWPLNSEHANPTARFEACSCSESHDAEHVMWCHGNGPWYHKCQLISSFLGHTRKNSCIVLQKVLPPELLSSTSKENRENDWQKCAVLPLLVLLSRSLFRSPTAPVWEHERVSPECKSASIENFQRD